MHHSIITDEAVSAATEALRTSGVVQHGRRIEAIECAALVVIEAAIEQLPDYCQLRPKCHENRDADRWKARQAAMARLGIEWV